jgi:RNA polymerase sigma-70 factor (sigma-E family)
MRSGMDGTLGAACQRNPGVERLYRVMIGAVPRDDVAVDAAAPVDVEALFRAEYRSLVRLAMLLVGDREAAEEVVQDSFVRLHTGADRLRDPAKAPAWLRSAVLNGARSRLRRRGVRRRHLAPVPGSSPAAEVAAIAGDDHRRIIAALRTLPTRQREAIVLRFYADLSEAETAAAMRVSAGSVKQHVHRGLASLGSVLEDER